MHAALMVASIWIVAAAPADELRCLPVDGAGPKPSTLFYSRLQQEAYAALDRRSGEFEKLKSAEDIDAYRKRLREFMLQQLGGLPERTPLHSQTVGTLQAEGYRIEKVIFDSQPGHRITANFYLPAGAGPFPGVVVSSGHSRTAKTAPYNQKFAAAMALNGIAALAFDPIGQGERSQILDADGQPQFSGTTTEHFLVGVGSILVGTNTARYRVWDGMRAVDYLASRPEIDPQRIGFTGCSGGGTLTSYVMALDDRIACAAPACYLTTFRRLIETIGPQDAEQNIFGQVAYGLDQPDYVLLRAPKPTIVSATTGDFFDIQGTWDNYRQAKRIYGRLGYPERVDLVEVEGGHGVQPTNLLAISRWMRRWLVGRDDAVAATDAVVRPEAELICTPRGQTLLLPGEKSVFDLNVERERKLAEQRKQLWSSKPRAELLEMVRKTAGVRSRQNMPKTTWDKAGKVEREGYHIDKVILRSDSGVPMPALTFHPPEPHEDVYLYIHDGGKAADDGAEGPIVKLVKEGYVVVAVDLRGWGETASSDKVDPILGDWKTFYLGYLLGKSLVGMRTEDIIAAGQWAADYQTKTPRKVHLIGVGQAAIPVLHAAALEPDLFTSVVTRDGPQSWSGIVGQKAPVGMLPSTIHGVLETYDLPDLVRAPSAAVR